MLRPYKILLPLCLLAIEFSCKTRRPISDVKLVDGEYVSRMSAEWQQNLSGVVGYLHKGYFVCTAFHLSPAVVVTAAHCLYRPDRVETENLLIEESSRKIKPIGFSYVPNLIGETYWNDIAVVKLDPQKLDPAELPRSYKLSKGIPPTTGHVRLVGFGSTSHAGDGSIGTKRTGTNNIDGVHDGFIDLFSTTDSGSGEVPGNTSATFGDSGGPLFNDDLEVLGVFSTFRQKPDANGKYLASYVPISTPQSLFIIRHAIESADTAVYAFPSHFFINSLPNKHLASDGTDRVSAFAGNWYAVTKDGIVNQLTLQPYKAVKVADISRPGLKDARDQVFSKFIVSGDNTFYASTRYSIRALLPSKPLISKSTSQLFPPENTVNEIYDIAWFSGALYVVVGKSLYKVSSDLSETKKIFTFETRNTRLAADKSNLYAVNEGSIFQWNSFHNSFDLLSKSFLGNFHGPLDELDDAAWRGTFYKVVAIDGVLYLGTAAGIYVYRGPSGSRGEVYGMNDRLDPDFDVDSKNLVLSYYEGISYAHRLSPKGASYIGSNLGCLTYDEQFELTNYIINGVTNARSKYLKDRESSYKLCL